MAIIDTLSTSQGTIVTLTGDIGMLESQELTAALDVLTKLPSQIVVLEMSQLTMLASCGIGALVAFRRAILKAGGAVRLAAVRPLVGETLKRAALHKLFEMHQTVELAFATPMPEAGRAI